MEEHTRGKGGAEKGVGTLAQWHTFPRAGQMSQNYMPHGCQVA